MFYSGRSSCGDEEKEQNTIISIAKTSLFCLSFAKSSPFYTVRNILVSELPSLPIYYLADALFL